MFHRKCLFESNGIERVYPFDVDPGLVGVAIALTAALLLLHRRSGLRLGESWGCKVMQSSEVAIFTTVTDMTTPDDRCVAVLCADGVGVVIVLSFISEGLHTFFEVNGSLFGFEYSVNSW